MNPIAEAIAFELVMHRTRLLELLTAITTAHEADALRTAEKKARDVIYQIVVPVLAGSGFDKEQPEKKGGQ